MDQLKVKDRILENISLSVKKVSYTPLKHMDVFSDSVRVFVDKQWFSSSSGPCCFGVRNNTPTHREQLALPVVILLKLQRIRSWATSRHLCLSKDIAEHLVSFVICSVISKTTNLHPTPKSFLLGCGAGTNTLCCKHCFLHNAYPTVISRTASERGYISVYRNQ